MTLELGYKNGGLVFADNTLCDNCCDAFIAVADDTYGGRNQAGLTALGTVRWDATQSVLIDDIVKTSIYIYRAEANGVTRYSLSNGYVDKLTTLNCNGIDVDSSGNIYIAHVRAGDVSVTKINSSGTPQWTYDTGGNALKIKLNADESQVAIVGDRADNGGGDKTLWVLATSNGAEQWTYHNNAWSLVSVDWDAFGNVYIVDPRGGAGCYKINDTPAIVWQWDVCTEAVGTCVDLNTYYHVITDSINVYLSASPDSLFALTVRGDVGSGEGRKVWQSAEGGMAASALDSDGNLYAIEGTSGDVHSVDPSNGDTIWTASAVLGDGTSIHAGNKPGALAWGCNNTYVQGDLAEHGGITWQAKINHISCGDEIWSAKSWTIGDRCFWPSQDENSAYKLTNNNKDSDDTTTPDNDADWVEDNDEPGAGNNWTDYWD